MLLKSIESSKILHCKEYNNINYYGQTVYVHFNLLKLRYCVCTKKKVVYFQNCLNVRFNRPGRRLVASSKVSGAVSDSIESTPWKILLDSPPKTKTSPDSRTTLFAFSASPFIPYKNCAESPMENETMGNPSSRLFSLSSRSCRA